MPKLTYRGSCLCGSVQYAVDKIEPHMAHCHCTMCRKFHGAAFATYGEAKAENFHWLGGYEMLESYTAENGSVRRFCKICGSSMSFAAKGVFGVVEFALGTLDSENDVIPDAHIFTMYKASWSQINDALPRYQEGRGSGDCNSAQKSK